MNDLELSTKIDAVKDHLCYRAKNAGLNPDRVFHFDHDGIIYIICNPIVGKEELYAYGHPTGEFINVRNVTAWYRNSFEDGHYKLESGIAPIRYPWLLARIEKDGTITYGDDCHMPNESQKIEAFQQLKEITKTIYGIKFQTWGVEVI